jgi:lipoprotein-releasing system permease protein
VKVEFSIALTHLLARRRQSLVSLSGILLGVGFFLGVAALMQGSERDFIERLIDNSPHITVSDEYRGAPTQPATDHWPTGAVEVRGTKPRTEVRGLRGYQQTLEFIESLGGLRAAPVLTGSAVLSFAGRTQAVTLSGVVPAVMQEVSSIREKMIAGSLDALAANPRGIVIGQGLADRFDLDLGDNLNVVTSSDQSRVLKVVGLFRTGNAGYDESQTFVALKRAQLMLERPDRVNRIIIRLDDPYRARAVAERIEAVAGYKTVSWLEASEDIMALLLVRNIIMYSVVGAILLVAAFGIYNTISTIALEKTRDIAILKSMGFENADVLRIFLAQGVILAVVGSLLGMGLGLMLIEGVSQVQIKPPGAFEPVTMPVYRGPVQFMLAAAFAVTASLFATWWPARKAARLQPVDILRGAT